MHKARMEVVFLIPKGLFGKQMNFEENGGGGVKTMFRMVKSDVQ